MKYTILFALVLFAFVGHSKYYWHPSANSTIKFKNNTIKFGESKSMIILGRTLHSIPPAVQFNNETIYNCTQVSGKAKLLHAEYSFQEYLLKELTPALSKLPDGRYSISLSNLVVGKKGKLVYYNVHDIMPISNQVQTLDRVGLENLSSSTRSQINESHSQKLSRKFVVQIKQQLERILDEVELSPVKSQNGSPINFLLPDSDIKFPGFITIENGKVGLEHFDN